MSDGSLSQDEIDALLQGTDDLATDAGFEAMSQPSGSKAGGASLLSQAEISTLQNILSSAANNEGEALGAMVGKTVSLTNPRIEVLQLNDLKNQLPGQIVEVKMNYEIGLSGEHSYILDINTAQIISGLMMGQEGGELTEASLSAISEAMNTISGNAGTTIGNMIKKELRTEPPVVNKIDKSNISLAGNNFVKVVYDLVIENNRKTLTEVFGLNVIKDITSSALPATNEMPNYGQQMAFNQQGMMGQQSMSMGSKGQRGPQVQNVQFANFNEIAAESQAGNINLLMDVTMDLTVELGRTKKTIKYILGMGEGTVLELDKLAGEPVDILVNGKLIARGEVVVIDENFGVRVTEIISPADRIQELT
jgi:flagellar motor switch protein FliN/FliY